MNVETAERIAAIRNTFDTDTLKRMFVAREEDDLFAEIGFLMTRKVLHPNIAEHRRQAVWGGYEILCDSEYWTPF